MSEAKKQPDQPVQKSDGGKPPGTADEVMAKIIESAAADGKLTPGFLMALASMDLEAELEPAADSALAKATSDVAIARDFCLKGLTTEQVAAKYGVSLSTAQKWRTGDRRTGIYREIIGLEQEERDYTRRALRGAVRPAMQKLVEMMNGTDPKLAFHAAREICRLGL